MGEWNRKIKFIPKNISGERWPDEPWGAVELLEKVETGSETGTRTWDQDLALWSHKPTRELGLKLWACKDDIIIIRSDGVQDGVMVPRRFLPPGMT
ncbi:unnamed protein product [Merluccius merluccius]